MRILVCGGREWTDGGWILRVLAQHDKNTVVIEGDARGADRLAGLAADQLGFAKEVYPANWAEHGKRAGYLRNTQMLVEGKPDLVYAFHSNIATSKGTAMMVRIAAEAGVKVIINPTTEPEQPQPLDVNLRRELNQQYEDLIVEIQERNAIIQEHESTIKTLLLQQTTLRGGMQVRKESASHHEMLRLAIEGLLAEINGDGETTINTLGQTKAVHFALNVLDLTKGDSF